MMGGRVDNLNLTLIFQLPIYLEPGVGSSYLIYWLAWEPKGSKHIGNWKIRVRHPVTPQPERFGHRVDAGPRAGRTTPAIPSHFSSICVLPGMPVRRPQGVVTRGWVFVTWFRR